MLMSDEPLTPPPAEPSPTTPPPVEGEGSIVAGCFAYFILCWVVGFITFKLSPYSPLNLGVPLVVVLFFSINVARRGWSRTHTGILIGLLLTLGAYLLLLSICGGHGI